MSFLDRFKIQPKYKSPDPEQRVAGVQELTDTAEDTAVLLSLAREDRDPRVRRAALDRTLDVGMLADLAATDADEGIRSELIDRLAGIASSSEASEDALRALGALSDPKLIGTVAKSSPIDAVRVEAVGRLTDVKTLSSVARQAGDARVAALAADRIQDPAELLNIAGKTDHKDAGIAALERAAALGATDRATLDGLADRAKNKSVGKRARAMVQAIDEQEAVRKAALEQHQGRVASFMARAEALASSATAPDARTRIDETEAEWNAFLAASTEPVAPDDSARFASALSSAREVLEREAAARAEREAREAELAAARSNRERLCELVDQMHGEDALDRLELARSEWEGSSISAALKLSDSARKPALPS